MIVIIFILHFELLYQSRIFNLKFFFLLARKHENYIGKSLDYTKSIVATFPIKIFHKKRIIIQIFNLNVNFNAIYFKNL